MAPACLQGIAKRNAKAARFMRSLTPQQRTNYIHAHLDMLDDPHRVVWDCEHCEEVCQDEDLEDPAEEARILRKWYAARNIAAPPPKTAMELHAIRYNPKSQTVCGTPLGTGLFYCCLAKGHLGICG